MTSPSRDQFRSPLPAMTDDPPNTATVHVPDEMYRWTLYDAPVAHYNWFQAVYKHDEEPIWMAIHPDDGGPNHHAIAFSKHGSMSAQSKTDAQCLLNLLTADDGVLANCKVTFEAGVDGGSGAAYEYADLD